MTLKANAVKAGLEKRFSFRVAKWRGMEAVSYGSASSNC